jgi:diguanylate cyclase (GGDEF)-like protein
MLVEHFVFIVIALLLLTSEVLGILSLRSKKITLRNRLFYVLAAEVWLWLLLNLLELLASSQQWSVIFMKLSFIPSMLIAPTLVWLGYAFVGEGQKKFIKYFFVPFLLLIVSMLTNELHQWFWIDTEFIQYGPFLGVHNIYGPLFYSFAILSYATIFFAAGVLLSNLINIAKYFRNKAVPAIILLSLTVFWNIAYVMNLIPLDKDFSPIVYNFILVILVYAAVRQKLFNVFLVPRQRIFDYIRDGVVIFDENETILDINQAALSLLHLEASCVGERLEDTIPFWDSLHFIFPEEESTDSDLVPSSVLSMGQSPEMVYLDVSISQIGYGFVMMLHDVTEIQKLLIQIEEMANFDSLTKLRNRRSFFNMVEGLIASAKRNRQPITVMLMDIDDFKQVNDQFGHSTGDRVLVQIASFLSTSLRAVDVKARYGGDEFIILLPQTDVEAAKIVSTRLFQGIEETIAEMGIPGLNVSVSIGVSGRDVLGRSQSLMEIVEEADKALYFVKNKGKGFSSNFFELQ